MGGGLHTAGGTFAEWRRARAHKPQPWEYVPPDFASEEWKKKHADDLFRSQMGAVPDADPETVRQAADDFAAQFDALARNWAWHEKKTVKEYYDQHRPDYRSWQEYEPDGWRDILPSEWRHEGSQPGDALDDLSWIGREYEGLHSLNADAMSLPQFLEQMDQWEQRFPEMADYAGIRESIREMQANGLGRTGERSLNQAMYRNKVQTIEEFMEGTRSSESSKSYFDFDGKRIENKDSKLGSVGIDFIEN